MSAPVKLRLLGGVLAGGASRRLGRDKSVERVGRDRMVDRAVRALNHVCEEVVVVSSRADAPIGPWRVVPDRRESVGPLSGIEAALTEARNLGCDGVFVLACDLPLVGPALATSVVDALGGADASAPGRVGEPGFEPLCAVYRTACLEVATALLDRGERAAHMLFGSIDGRRIDVAEDAVLNVNTEADLARARALAEGGGVDR